MSMAMLSYPNMCNVFFIECREDSDCPGYFPVCNAAGSCEGILVFITKTRPCNIQQFLKTVKMIIF